MPCHGENNPSSGLNLTSYNNVIAGSNSGSVISIGDYENSVLWQEVSSGDMPNNIAYDIFGITDLSDEEVQLIANWILDLECMSIDCLPEYTCVLGECVCINDSDQNGICDEFESTNTVELSNQNKLIHTFDLFGRKHQINKKENTLIHLYDDGSIQKMQYIK
tara:strand:- start:415 stop:903 length:489 start_codon:yes stop_codon:yes gene_type:complete